MSCDAEVSWDGQSEDGRGHRSGREQPHFIKGAINRSCQPFVKLAELFTHQSKMPGAAFSNLKRRMAPEKLHGGEDTPTEQGYIV